MAVIGEMQKLTVGGKTYTIPNTNYYHTTGTWDGLTYTATANGGAGVLAFTIPTGSTATTVAAGNHSHGNITNGGDITATAPTIANGDQIIINDNSASKITNGPTFDGSTTTTALTPKGTWESFLNSNSTLNAAKLSGAIPSAVTATTQASTDNSTKIATTAYVTTAIAGLPQPMVFKGSVGTGGTTTWANLESATNHEGWTYKVITAHTAETGKPAAAVGDTIISNGSEWIVIPSGDEPSGTVTSVGISNATNGGLSVSNSPITSSGNITVGHSNVLSSAQTTQAVYPIAIDKNGHISSYGTAVTISDTKVNVVSRGTTKAYLLGTTTSPTSSNQAVESVAETGVYFDTTAATLVATTFKGALTGTASGNVPNTRTVNSKALSADISLTASDVGAASSSHTHGNLTNDGKITSTATIANGDKLVIVDSDTTAGSKITGSSITFDGTTTTQALTKKGTWGTFLTSYTEQYTGTVTSVAASGDNGISISGSPITSEGTITIGLNLSTAINGLGEGTSAAQRDDYIVAQYAGGGTTTTTYHRRKLSNIFKALNSSDITTALGYTPYNSTNPNGYTSNQGTVKKVSTGVGLTGGDVTETGTIKANLTSDTALSNAALSVTEDSNRIYPVRVDKNSKLVVVVPWTNVNSSYLTAASTLDATKLSGTIPSGCYTNSNTTYTLTNALSSHKYTWTFTAGGSGSGSTTTTLELAAGTGMSIVDDTSNKKITINHSNSVTAQTTQALYPIKIDAQGHISAYGTAVTIPDVSGKIDTAGTGLSKSGTTLNHSNSVTAQTTQAVYPIKIDAQGHISAYGSAVTIVNTRGTAASGGTTLSVVNTGDMYTWNNKLNLSGGTLTGRVTTTKAINDIITGSGTAASDAGSGVSPRYFPAKWTFNTGLTATNGDIIVFKIPVAGHSYGVFMSIDNGTHYYPIVVSGTSRLTTHYGNGTQMAVIFDSSGSAADMFALTGGDSRATVSGGVWRVLNYYDSGNTYTTAYCSTAAATAAKTATCSGYTARAKTHMLVTITNSNTAASALTLNINSQGAKPIYINGSASSSSNYTLNNGTYLVYYDGTNYYFRTDGQLQSANGILTSNTGTVTSITLTQGTGISIGSSGTAITTSGSRTISLATITKSDTTSTASPAHGGTFTAVDSITYDTYGRVTGVNTKTVTLPASGNTDTKVTVAALTSGTAYYPILATGTGTATRQIDSTLVGLWYKATAGVADATTAGTAVLRIGNDKAIGTADNTQGILRIFGSTAKYMDIKTETGQPAANRTVYLPSYTGTMYLTCTSTTDAVGGTSVPVYVTNTGRIAAVDSLEMGLIEKPFLCAQGSGSISLSNGVITQVPITSTLVSSEYSGISIDSNKKTILLTPGIYRISGSVYISATVTNPLIGVYLRMDLTSVSFADASEEAASYVMGGVSVNVSKIVKVIENCYLWLGARYGGSGTGTVAAGNCATYLEAEQIGSVY